MTLDLDALEAATRTTWRGTTVIDSDILLALIARVRRAEAALRDIDAITSAIFSDSECGAYAIALAKDAKAQIRSVARAALEGRSDGK